MPGLRGKYAAASVKRKLLALFGCMLAGFLLIVLVNALGARRVEHTLTLERLAVTASFDVLSMRRQEKNYFLRHDPDSLAAVRRHQQAATAALATIGDLDPDHNAVRDKALALLRQYLHSLLAMTANADDTGTDAAAARFLASSRALDRFASESPALAQDVERVHLLEKRWLASGSTPSRQALENAVGRLAGQAAGEQPPELATVVADYRQALAAYAGRLEAEGSPDVAFVAAARALEPLTDELRQSYAARSRAIAHDTALVSTSIEAGVVVLVGLAAWAVFRSVAAPLASLGRHARRVARGEETDLDPAAFSGEFHELAEDIRRMEQHLVATILDLARKEREAADEARRAREARKRAEDLSRVKSNFLSLVSHELKTPLTSMVGFAQVMLKRLERGPLAEAARERPELAAETERLRENLDIMFGEGHRLDAMIDNVLELASLEAGDAPLAMHPVSVGEMVELAIAPYRQIMEAKGLTFVRDIPRDLPPLCCDRERMVYVLRHLFSNAVKFTDAGHVACRVRREQDMAVIRVEDTGRGIPAAMREAVFEKFLQLGDSLTDKMPGLGIGLAASRAVVEYHGGSIRIAGAPGRGSTVTITVPLAEAA